MFDIKRDRIYKHTMLDQREADRLKPLVESAFRDELSRYDNGREDLKQEKIRFITEQFANRMRVSKNMGVNPLYEDAKIFGESMPQLKNLFESVSTPSNVIGMGNVRNPMNMNDVSNPSGMWNAGYKPGTGDVPSYVFGLQNQLALHCVGFDLMPTIAVDTPKVVVTYVDTVYGGGTFDSKENLPSYVEVTNDLFTKSWIKDYDGNGKSLKRHTSELYFIHQGTSDNIYVRVRFMLGSTISSSLFVEVLETGECTTLPVTGTTPGVYSHSNNFSFKQVIDRIVADGTQANRIIAFDDGTAANCWAGTFASQVITYGYASATRTNIAEAASNDNSLGGMNREQHEKGPAHKLNVISMDKQLEMVGLEIEADTSNIQIKDMAAMGVNVISHLYTGVQNQLVQSLDEVITDHLYKLGVTHALNAYKAQGINYSLYIDDPNGSTSDTLVNLVGTDILYDITDRDVVSDFGSIPNETYGATYENQMTHGERLYSRILVVAEFIAQQNRIGAPDFILLGGELCATLKKQGTFKLCPSANTLSSNPELHYTGTIFDTINVYKNPKIDFNDPRILLGRRGDDKDPGAKFLAYDLAASRQIVAEQTMAEKIRVWSRFQIADIGFYPELNYYTMVAINKLHWA